MQIKEVVTLPGKRITAELEVVHMDIRGGMMRSKLVSDAMKGKYDDAVEYTLALGTFPRMMGCLKSGTITRETLDADGQVVEQASQDARALTFREFIELPDEIGLAWTTAMEAENPNIYGVPAKEDGAPLVSEDAEKKSAAPGRG